MLLLGCHHRGGAIVARRGGVIVSVVPAQLLGKVIELGILFALYGTIAHGVQRFRTFQVLAAVLACTCLFIAFVCFHQGLTPKQCVAGQERAGELSGIPDGRLCELNEDCHRNIPEGGLGFEYRCEHVGLFGTYSMEERVRYRGELQDPNEVSLVVAAGALSLLIAYQTYRLTLGFSPWLFGLTVFDLAVLWLTWHEYRRQPAG